MGELENYKDSDDKNIIKRQEVIQRVERRVGRVKINKVGGREGGSDEMMKEKMTTLVESTTTTVTD